MLVSRERIGDFQTAFTTLGRPLDPALIVPGGFDLACGSRGAERLMAAAEPPTAIIAANDLAAMGAIAWLQAHGRRVPDDVSVVGYDDIPFARVFQPSITTVTQPLYQMGEAAMTALVERLAAQPAESASDRNVWLAATLAVRQSTGPCRRQPAEDGPGPDKKRKTASDQETTREERRDHEDNPP
jgi:DNA-binding LacI/PurR family transcriptional regulator